MSNVEKMYEAVQPVMRTSRAEDAIQALRNILNSFPDFARAHNDLASLLYQTGQKQEALKYCESAAAADPTHPDFLKMLGDFYYVESARIEDALRLYRKVLKLRPADVQTRMTVAHILLSLKRFDEAEEHYFKVLEIDPEQAEASAIHRELSKRRNGGKTGANCAESMHAEAKRSAELGDAEGASRQLERLVGQHPDFALAHNDLAVVSHRKGDTQKALRHYEKAAHLEPNNITYLKNLADFYYIEQNRIKDALQLYVNVLELVPEDTETLLALGKICKQLRQDADARIFYERALEIEPWNQIAQKELEHLEANPLESAQELDGQAVHAEAVRLASSGDSRGALELLERLTEACPDVALFHNDLAVLAYQAGDRQKALTHYEHAARLAPYDPTFRKNLADCCWVGFNRTEDALKIYVDILKTHPEDIETLMATGRLCRSLGQSDDARVFFERIMEIEPWNTEARDQLSAICAQPQAA